MEKQQKQEMIQHMINILRSLDIEMSVYGCGCCGSPSVRFIYKSEIIVDDKGDSVDDCQFSTGL